MNRSALVPLAVAMALAGCASIENAGHASYTVKPFKVTGADGSVALACCELAVVDGKEFADRTVGFQTNGAGFMFQVVEGQSKAFKGQGIAAKALSVLPVTGLQDILK